MGVVHHHSDRLRHLQELSFVEVPSFLLMLLQAAYLERNIRKVGLERLL
jgi:hypothetical protein